MIDSCSTCQEYFNGSAVKQYFYEAIGQQTENNLCEINSGETKMFTKPFHEFNWNIYLALAFVWIYIYFSSCKNIKITSKFSIFSFIVTTFCFIFVFIRCVTATGFLKKILFLILFKKKVQEME